MLNGTAQLTRYNLGRWYASYRFIIALSLLLITTITQYVDAVASSYPIFYLFLLGLYFICASLQWLLLRFTHHFPIHRQFLALFIVDVVILSSLTFASDGPSLQISLLFVMTIFSASLLLERKKSLIITLISVICVIYQHFIGSLFNMSSMNNIGNSALLAFLFFGVYALGQLAVGRFQNLESTNFSQAQELRRLQEINSYILDQIEIGYIVLDENYHVVLTTPAACHFLAIHQNFSYQKQPLYSIQPELFDTLHFEGLIDGEIFEFEAKNSLYQLQIQVQKLKIPNQSLTLLVLQDARTLNQRVQQLKLAALGQLSASIAHEIRNPLAAISQANELLTESLPAEHHLLTGMISKQSKRIDKIVQDTLNMVRNKETRASLVDLAQFIPQFLTEDLADALSKIDTFIEKEVAIYFDESQLRQVLINLLRNALRHNSNQQQAIELHVYTQHNHARIEVRDFGSGVATTDIASLFKPFFSTEINGTGLGLYLSHSFCEANQAKLYYVEQQQGACFRIECLRVQHD